MFQLASWPFIYRIWTQSLNENVNKSNIFFKKTLFWFSHVFTYVKKLSYLHTSLWLFKALNQTKGICCTINSIRSTADYTQLFRILLIGSSSRKAILFHDTDSSCAWAWQHYQIFCLMVTLGQYWEVVLPGVD